MNSYDRIMGLGIALSGLLLLSMFVGPWTYGYAPVAAVISVLYLGGLTYWCWRIYITASALIEPAEPEHNRKGVFLLAGIGAPVVFVADVLLGIEDRTDLVGLVGNAASVLILLSLFYAMWLTAKALNGVPAGRFALFNNGVMFAFLKIFYLPLGLYFLRRRMKDLFPA
jgi:hypothetical protein